MATLAQVMILFSDRGTPASYRHMNGYSSHTLRFVGKTGKASLVKLHYKTESGIKCLSGPEADALRGVDADHATRDLYEHIAKGQEAAWRLFIQVRIRTWGLNSPLPPIPFYIFPAAGHARGGCCQVPL